MSKLVAEFEYHWYLDITRERFYSVRGYPFLHRDGIPLCKRHGDELELDECVIPDREADAVKLADYCWKCE